MKFFETLKISPTCSVILRLRFPKPWGSHLTPQASSWGFVIRIREDLILYTCFFRYYPRITIKDRKAPLHGGELLNLFPHWGGLGGCAFISLFTFNRSCIYEIDSTCHGMSLHYMKIGRNTLRPSILYSLVGAWFIMLVSFQDKSSYRTEIPGEGGKIEEKRIQENKKNIKGWDPHAGKHRSGWR